MSAFVYIDEVDTQFGNLVSVELFGTIGDDINHMMDALPIGSIVPILSGLPGCPAVDLDIWKECDGTMIDHPTSPLRMRVVPDWVTEGRYMRMYDFIGNVGNFYGANFKNFIHGHGGFTGFNPGITADADTDDDFWTAKDHQHAIAPDLYTPLNFEPEHVRIKHYMKINNANTIKGGKFKDMQKDFGTTIAQALWVKAGLDQNSLDKANPIGMLMMFMATQPLLPAMPDPGFWQLCNGSTVTDANSPLFGQVLPDLTQKFFRHPEELEAEFSLGGQPLVDLVHNHGGSTGQANDRNDFQMDGGDEKYEAGNHQHGIAYDLDVTDTTPAYIELQLYVRIN